MLALMSIALVGCNSDPLKAGVEALKGSLPVKLGEIATIDDINSAEGVVTLNVSVAEAEGSDFDALSKDSKNITNGIAYLVLGNKGALNSLASLIKEANAGVNIKFTGANSKKSFEGKLAAAEAAKLVETPSADMALANKIAIDNLGGPYDVNEDGDIKTGLTAIDGDNVVYTLNVSPAKFDGKLDVKELKKFFTGVFTDPTIAGVSDELELVKAANKGAKWIYKNVESGKELTFTFTAEEVKALEVSK